ncbi:helix-turn-helix domain-containing protein [Aggregatilinea lenta]|uniref:helix-turn-helix domain-containing protein n=1 Tax=Aggregatilinea lenta TaxID=913108 RepID=UPI0013C3052B|nr:helix-turn-helix domain-containing protein [Aggregatilinea lenta]
MSFSDFAARLRQQSTDRAESARPPRSMDDVHLLRARILGVLIRDARQTARLPLDECAAQIGVDKETLLRWEFGQAMPSLPQIELLAYALDVPVAHFWGTQTLSELSTRRAVDRQQYVLLRDRLIGAMVRAARQKHSLTAEQIAAEAGLPVPRLLAYEMGEQPIPLPILVTLAHVCQLNLSAFLEGSSRIGSALALREDVEHYRALAEDVRHFVALPVNQSYLELAMRLSALSTSELRGVAEAILNITL